MEILLAILVLLLVVLTVYFWWKLKKEAKEKEELKRQAIFLSKKELEFLEFAADMYIKYSEELKIHNHEQHQYIIAELERVRKTIEEKISSLSQEQHLP